jgi:alpha-tubulin suppressor-like RCC1 family protein
VTALSGVTDIGNGRLHSLAIENRDTVWTWGLNSTGQLGLGNTTNQLSPVKVPGLSGAFGLGGGVNYSVVLHT